MRRLSRLSLGSASLSVLSLMLAATGCTSTTPPPPVDNAESQREAPRLDLWAGVPPIEAEAGDIAAELLPVPGPQPPPSVSQKVELPFPPPAPPSKQTQDRADDGPLQVLRTSPTEKEPGQVGAVSAVFNHAMVPLASVDDLKLQRSPLAISPQPPGRFRWLGTQMIAFEPAGRMPFSTTYTATVAAGETATDGAALAKPVSWQFSTPLLAIESAQPSEYDQAELEPTVIVRFNQDVQADALVAALRLAGGGDQVAVSAVPQAQWSSLPEPHRSAAMAGRAERTLVLKPQGQLRPDTQYTLTIPPGAYGEGPNPSKALTTKFRTYPPLRLTAPNCKDPYAYSCTASGVTIEASTPVVDDPELAQKVRVSPAVEDLEVSGGGGITLGGKFRGLGTYTIEVDAGVRDVYGQTLQRPWRGTVTLRPLDPALQIDGVTRDPVVLEPSHRGVLDLKATGLTDVEVRSYAFGPDALRATLQQRSGYYDEEWMPLLPESSAKSFAVSQSRAETMTLPLATREMGVGPGNFLLVGARSNKVGDYDWKYRLNLNYLVEVTRLGVTAALDGDSGVVLVTDIETGEPLQGVQLGLWEVGRDAPEWSGTSDASGAATLTHGRMNNQPFILARLQGDAAYVPLHSPIDGSWSSWQYDSGETEPRAFFYTEREPHKPGETVHLSGVLREETRGPQGGVQMYRADIEADYVVNGPRGHEVAKGKAKITPFGTFSVDIPIPADSDLGSYGFRLEMPSGIFAGARTFYHSFAVEEYRTPEFEVKVARESEATLVYGDTLAAEVRANYLHGAPMVGAAVSYTLRRSDTSFRPPGSENEAFSFGPNPVPTWWRPYYGPYGGFGGGDVLVKQGAGETDASGEFAVSHLLQAREQPWGVKPPLAPAKEEDKKGPPDPPPSGTYTLEAQVTDQNRQAIAGRQSFVVHPASEYAGVRTDRSVYKEGETARIEAVVVDVAGARVKDRAVKVSLVRSETKRTAVEDKGKWSYKYETADVSVGGCELVSDAAPASCEVAVDKAGSYTVRAELSDPKGNKALTRHTLYVYGKDAVVWDQDQRRVDLVPDKRTYEPGEEATILLRSPFDRARGLALIEREGIVTHQLLTIEGGAGTLKVPLDESMIPGVNVAVVLTRGRVDIPGAPPDQDLGRPAVASGQLDLTIASTRKKIALELKTDRPEVAPKDTLKLEIQARDASAAGRDAAVAIMVVDEGVLSLMNYQTPDPLAFFHHARSAGVSLFDLRQFLLARTADDAMSPEEQTRSELDNRKSPKAANGHARYDDAEPMKERSSAPGGGAPPPAPMATVAPTTPVAQAMPMEEKADKKKSGGKDVAELDGNVAMNQPVSLRTLFAATAYFNPEVRLGDDGMAEIEIPMPENLTTFRVMAVAVDPKSPDQFGSAETQVKVRKPIMLRPSLPRFANFGDSFQGSVMVDNQTDADQAIVVGTRGTNVVLGGATEVPIEVPAGQSREVRFPMAVDRVGTMRLQFAALSNGGRDATEVSLPVLYPATRQAFADYGVTDGSVSRAIKVPEGMLPGFGGLDVSLSSTALTGLEDAVEWLVGYRYECTEQLASRLLPIFVLGPILEQFPIADTKDLAKRQLLATGGIGKLLTRQNYDGGFRYWDTSDRSSPYLSAWATFALLEGKKAGFKVDEDAIARAMRYLENFVRYGESTPWGRYYDDTSRTFALWLLSREGSGGELFDTMWAQRGNVPLYARAQLMSAAERFGRSRERGILEKEFRARVTETAKTAHFVESKSEVESDGLQLLMHSDVQTDAIALMAMLELTPDDPLLPKVMAGIMDDRDPQKGGQWGTTHANAWALLAASRYFTTVEKEVPDYVARIWLDTAFAGEQSFKGRSMTVTEQQVPMARLMKEQPKEVLLAKDGPGKLYYRLGLRYAPADLAMKAEEQGFTVSRTYEPLAQGGDTPDPESVKRLPDGTWEIKAGALVRVNLTLVAKDRANFVVVDDPLPAGFEGQNSKFATTLQDVTGGVNNTSVDRGDIWGTGERGWWYWRWWWSFSHTELRDDRMLLFANHLPAGVYTYSYTARATSIGEFQLPPVHAEAMYMPELFGHSASSRVRVVE
ncbi:MAG: Ig-like domain-containing protein [Myxococcales bacterium]|nr:Ig-like domain-containing protein [Myxococcales bacterium]